MLLTTLLAAWSPARLQAALRVTAFLLAMVVAYYVTSELVFGFTPLAYLLAWGAIAVFVAPLFALLVWPARRQGWFAVLGAAVPVALLLWEAYPLRWFLPRYALPVGFNLVAAVALLVLLARGWAQRARWER